MQHYILIGDSGHSKVIQDCIESNSDKVIAKLDDKHDIRFEEEAIVKGPLSLLSELLTQDVKVIIAIGSNQIRKKIIDKLQLNDQSYGTAIHKTAIISGSAKIGYGTVVMPGAIINADSKIGNHCIINSSAIVEHDNLIEDFVHISPNATLTGGVHVEQGTQIGAAAVVIPTIKIGSWSMVGAGSTVTKDLPSKILAVGTPARTIKVN